MVNLTVPNNKSKVAASFFVFFFYIFHSISCIFSHFFLTTLSFFFTITSFIWQKGPFQNEEGRHALKNLEFCPPPQICASV